jgi:hypothetical protein
MIEEIQYIQSGLQHIPFDILNLTNHPFEELQKLSTQALEAYLYGAKIIARKYHNKIQNNQPTITQILAHLPPQFHSDLIDKSELDPGELT